MNFTHRSEFFFGVVRICNDRVSAAQLWAELCSALPVHIQMSPRAVNAKTNGQGLPILLVKSELRIEATLTPNTPNLDPTLTPNTPNYSDEPGGSNIIPPPGRLRPFRRLRRSREVGLYARALTKEIRRMYVHHVRNPPTHRFESLIKEVWCLILIFNQIAVDKQCCCSEFSEEHLT